MKKINSFLFITSNFLLLTSLFLFGCNSKQLTPETSLADSNNFPPELVGVWIANNALEEPLWGFKFEPDGRISKFRHGFIGYVNNDGNSIYLTGPDPNAYATFVFGPVESTYDADSRELAVKVILEHYVMKMPAGTLEGNCDDYFSGTISDDWKVWHADWIGYSWLEGATPPDPNDPPEPITFKKLSEEELARYKDVKPVMPHPAHE